MVLQLSAFKRLFSVDIRVAFAPCLDHLQSQLQRIAIKCVILHLHEYRELDKLSGDTSEERWQYFHSLLASEQVQHELAERYPLLFDLLHKRLEQFHFFIREFLQRFEQDQEQLAEFLSFPPDKLPKIDSIALHGDPHNHGRSVIGLTLDNKAKVYYKPRSLLLEQVLQQQFALWQQEIEHWPHFVLPEQLLGDNYGWQKAVNYQPCKNSAEIKHFYYQTGQWLALAYWLGSSDLHAENLIVHQASPVFIDGETLLQPLLKPVNEWTIFDTMLLPNIALSNDQHPGIDLSGIGYASGNIWPEKKEALVDEGTDLMHIGMEYSTLPARDNLPQPNYKLNNSDYLAVAAGFSDLITLLSARGAEMTQALQHTLSLHIISQRILLRPTQTYGQLLLHSNHPELLKDEQTRKQYFMQLRNSRYKVPDAVLEDEVQQLMRGDIPYFMTTVVSRNIYDDKHQRLIKDAFICSASDALQLRLENLSAKNDLSTQTYIIQQAFASMQRNRNPTENIIASKNEFNNSALLIDDAQNTIDLLFSKLKSSILIRDDYIEIWGSTALNGKDWTVRRFDDDFYSGSGGILLTTMSLYLTQKNKVAFELTEKIYSYLLQHFTKPRQLPLGLSGYAGLLYTSRFVEENLPSLSGLSDLLLENINHVIASKQFSFDFFDGICGLLVVLLNQRPYDSLVQNCLSILQENYDQEKKWWPTWQFPTPLLGFSHGYSGFAYALAVAGKILGNSDYTDWAKRLLSSEESYFDTKQHHWPDMRIPPDNVQAKPPLLDAWCHGAAGILLTRLAIAAISQQPADNSHFRAAIDLIIKGLHGVDLTYCHGDSSRLSVLAMATAAGENIDLKQYQNDFIENAYDQAKKLSSDEVFTPGFMTGTAGVIYQLLQILYPARLPTVMLLR